MSTTPPLPALYHLERTNKPLSVGGRRDPPPALLWPRRVGQKDEGARPSEAHLRPGSGEGEAGAPQLQDAEQQGCGADDGSIELSH